jgi:hypothetical protein
MSSRKIDLEWDFTEFVYRSLDWRYSQSCWYFRPCFVNFSPSNLISGSPFPAPLACVNTVSLLCTCLQWKWGVWVWVHRRGGGLGQINTCRKV